MTFYRTQNCPGCQAVEDTLRELAVAYDSVVLKAGDKLPDELSKHKLPILIDEGQIIQGSNRILDHLSELADFKKQWYKYQSDACYCEDE